MRAIGMSARWSRRPTCVTVCVTGLGTKIDDIGEQRRVIARNLVSRRNYWSSTPSCAAFISPTRPICVDRGTPLKVDTADLLINE